MDAPALKNGSLAQVELVPYFEHDGSPVAIVIIKQAFQVSRHGHVVRTPDAEVRMVDEFWYPDRPETSSVKFASDVCLRKPSTDIVVVGSAMAPYRAPSRQLDVVIRVGDVNKTVRVFGPRAWYRWNRRKMRLTEPQHFEQQNLQWEFAWGGSDYESDPKNPMEEPRNPNGRGLAADPNELEGQVGPSIEDPDDLISDSGSRPKPAGTCVIGRHWAPRRRYTGTIDDQWMEERMPLLPLDFDERFNQVAPPDLITTAPLRGGERVEVFNMHEEGPVAFDLPKIRFFVGSDGPDGLVEHPPMMDTLVLEPTSRRFDMVWRTTVPIPRRPSEQTFIQVHEKQVT